MEDFYGISNFNRQIYERSCPERDAIFGSAVVLDAIWIATGREVPLTVIPEACAHSMNFSVPGHETKLTNLEKEIQELVGEKYLKTLTTLTPEQADPVSGVNYANISRSLAVFSAALNSCTSRKEEAKLIAALKKRLKDTPVGYIGSSKLLHAIRKRARSSPPLKKHEQSFVKILAPLARKERTNSANQTAGRLSSRTSPSLAETWESALATPIVHGRGGVELVRNVELALSKRDPRSLLQAVATIVQAKKTNGDVAFGSLSFKHARNVPKRWTSIFNGELQPKDRELVSSAEKSFRRAFEL